MAGISGYVLAALFGRPLQGGIDAHTLLLWGLGANFLISVVVVLVFSTRMAADLRARERELARLRERFTRNEGIVALATHAAAMAHELNTPLATMTLLADEISAEVKDPDLRADVATLSQLLALCRERIRNLAVPTAVDLVRVVGQWRLIRPTIDLQRSGSLPSSLRVDPAIAHLLQALLNTPPTPAKPPARRAWTCIWNMATARCGAKCGTTAGASIPTGPAAGHQPVQQRQAGRPGRGPGAVARHGRTAGRRNDHDGRRRRGHPHPFLSASRHIRDLTMNPTDLGLLIDDDELYVRTLQRSLSRRGLKPAPPPASPRLRVAEEIRPAFALVDLRLGEDSG